MPTDAHCYDGPALHWSPWQRQREGKGGLRTCYVAHLSSETLSSPELIYCLSVLWSHIMGLCCREPRVEKHFSLQGTEQALTITGSSLLALTKYFSPGTSVGHEETCHCLAS